MSLQTFTCSSCSGTLMWNENFAGKDIACYLCGATVRMPAAAPTTKASASPPRTRYYDRADEFHCGKCSTQISISGPGQVSCPQCKTLLDVPEHPRCPKCKSENTVFHSNRLKSGAASLVGTAVGGALFGLAGGIIGAGVGRGMASYHCKDCRNNWRIELPEVRR